MTYPADKPCGVPWFSDVPTRWEIRRLRTVAGMRVSNVDKHTKEDEVPVRLCNYVDVYKNDRITQQLPFMTATASKDEVEKFRLNQNDVIITKDSETWDDIGVPALVTEPSTDLISGYHLAILRPGPDVFGPYLFWALQSKPTTYQFHIEAKGVTRYGLSHNGIQSISIPLPPLPEQAAIVRYLDDANQRIRAYVSAKERLIGLLEEVRQALIHQAVTRGLDPNVRLKPSGVEWLGEVPVHWGTAKLGLLATKFGSGITPRGGATVYQASGIPFLRSQNIHFDGLRLEGVARITPDLHTKLSSSRVHPGDVLLNITGASIGRVCTVPQDFAEGNVNQHVCIIRPKPGAITNTYLSAYLSTPMMQKEIQVEQSGASREGLTLQSIKDFQITVPPIHEQQSISERITETNGTIFGIVSHARRQIDLINEYRTRLIADVVTGKLDAREAAGQLPDPENGDWPAEHQSLSLTPRST